MPIYEYRCNNCGHQFEKLESLSAEPIQKCPECGKQHAERQISASGFHLKGEGWYVNDYKKKPKESASETKPTENKPAENKKETKDKKDPAT